MSERGRDELASDQCIELAEQLVWAKVRSEIANTLAVIERFSEGPFRYGYEMAIEELECRLELRPSEPVGPLASQDGILARLANDGPLSRACHPTNTPKPIMQKE